MKKLILIVLLCIYTLSGFSQESISKLFCNKIIETTQAVIVNEKITKYNNRLVECDLPKYITQDLIILACQLIKSEYSDIKIHKNWIKEDNTITIVYSIDNNFIIITYSILPDNSKILIFIY